MAEAAIVLSTEGASLATPDGSGPTRFGSLAVVVLALLAFYTGMIVVGLRAIGPVPSGTSSAAVTVQAR